MKRKKVFLGFVDIAGQLSDFAKGYKYNGYSTKTFVYARSRYYSDEKYDYIYDDLYPKKLVKSKKKYIVFIRKIITAVYVLPNYYLILIMSLFECHIYHFIWYKSFEMKYFLILLKILKKRIIVSFVGSDIKWVPSWMEEFVHRSLDFPDPKLRMENTIKQGLTLKDQLKYIRTFEKYADLIISFPEQAQLQLRPYLNFYIPVEIEKIRFKTIKNDKILVVLGTTEFKAKGSEKLITDITSYHELNKDKFDLFIINDMEHTQVIKILEKADIFIYTPYGCGSGKFGMEALAAGCVLLTGYDKKWLLLPPNPPIVHVQEIDLLQKLDFFLKNQNDRESLSFSGRKWVEKYAKVESIIKDILFSLECIDTYDYKPTFFRNNATFTSNWDAPDSIYIANYYTEFVKKCNWYKKYIQPGERDGLKF